MSEFELLKQSFNETGIGYGIVTRTDDPEYLETDDPEVEMAILIDSSDAGNSLPDNVILQYSFDKNGNFLGLQQFEVAEMEGEEGGILLEFEDQ